MEAYMPADMRNRIRAVYEIIRQLEPEDNPVKKILLVVAGYDAEVHIKEITDMEGDGKQRPAQRGTRRGNEHGPLCSKHGTVKRIAGGQSRTAAY